MNVTPGRRKRKRGVEVAMKKGVAMTEKRGRQKMTGTGANTGRTRIELKRM